MFLAIGSGVVMVFLPVLGVSETPVGRAALWVSAATIVAGLFLLVTQRSRRLPT
jgi:hypothetical protein